MTTNNEVQTTEVFFDKGTLFDLYIGKPTFQKKLRSNDMLLEGTVNEDAFYLGHKKLLPKEAMARLLTLEGHARTALAGRSLEFPLSGARFVYFRALPDLLVRLRALQTEWRTAVQELVSGYPELKAQQLAALDKQSEDLMGAELAKLTADQRKARQPELNDWLEQQKLQHRKLYPQVEELPAMFHFSWRMFKVSAMEGLEEMNTLQQDELIAAKAQIAQLKALGYSSREVGMHYVKFALIIVAIGTPRASATNNGPGVGGTSECVIVAPATIASTPRR